MYRAGFYFHRNNPNAEIKKSRLPRVRLSCITRLSKHDDIFKNQVENLPEDLRTVLNTSTVLPVDKVYPTFNFFSKEDITHRAFEEITFVGVISYTEKKSTDFWYPPKFTEYGNHQCLYISVRLPYSRPVANKLYESYVESDRDFISDLYKTYTEKFDTYQCSNIEPGQYGFNFLFCSLPKLYPSQDSFRLLPEVGYNEEQDQLEVRYTPLYVSSKILSQVWRTAYKSFTKIERENFDLPAQLNLLPNNQAADFVLYGIGEEEFYSKTGEDLTGYKIENQDLPVAQYYEEEFLYYSEDEDIKDTYNEYENLFEEENLASNEYDNLFEEENLACNEYEDLFEDEDFDIEIIDLTGDD